MSTKTKWGKVESGWLCLRRQRMLRNFSQCLTAGCIPKLFAAYFWGLFLCMCVCVCVEYIHLYREQTIALCLSNLFAGICFPRRLYAAIIVYANWHK